MFLVDSSLWVEYFRSKGSRKVKERLREVLQKEEVVCCGMVVVEILRGAKNEKDFQSLQDALTSAPQIPIEMIVLSKEPQDGGYH